nr:hypothetical protein CparaKRNrm1_p132 [Cryptomonas paramecium]
MYFKNFYYNHIQKCCFFLKNKQHVFLDFFYFKFFYDKFSYVSSQNSELNIYYHAFVNFQSLNFSRNFLLGININFLQKLNLFFGNNWIFDYKIFAFFIEQKENNLHIIQKKYIHCIHGHVDSNTKLLKKITCNFIYFSKTFLNYIIEIISFAFNSFFKIRLQHEVRVYNNVQDTLNKFSSINSTDITSNSSLLDTNTSELKNFILEIFERNTKSSFFSVFYNIILYSKLKKIEKEKYFYFFGLLYLNFQDKNRFEKIKSREKNYKEECKSNSYINSHLKKKFLENMFKRKKLFEIYSFFGNFINRLTFSFLKFLIYKTTANFLYKIEKLFDSNAVELMYRLLNKKLLSTFNPKKITNIFLKISEKMKSFKRESVSTKTYLTIIKILKNCSKYSKNKNFLSV